MHFGLDFGTTNSAVALFDGDRLVVARTDPTNENPQVTPSLVYINREDEALIGAQAAQAYLENETGRPVRWRRRDAGMVEVTVASLKGDPIQFFDNISVMVDIAARGKLLQSIKRALFNERYEGTQIFEKFYRVEDLIAIILKHMKEAAEREFGKACEGIVMGRPVRFSTNPLADARAEAILFKAAHLAGFRNIRLQFEPVGVAGLIHRSSPKRRTALIFDFGGGTLDLTIATIGGDILPKILATEGVLVGGDDLDRRIMFSLLDHFGGAEHLPHDMVEKLLSWQTMPELSRPEFVERLRILQKNSADPEPYFALEALVSENLGFKLFKEIERTKRILSTEQSATLDFYHEDLQIRRTITRRRFQRMISAEIDMVREGIDEVLAKASLSAAQVDTVLRTGGSSQVPAFVHLLTEIFGAGKIESIDPLVSVVGGFAVTAHELHQNSHNSYPVTIHDLQVHSEFAYTTHLITLDAACYVDADYIVDRLPPALSGLTAIQTAIQDENAEEEDKLCFRVDKPVQVYIAYDDTLSERLPDWLREFEMTAMNMWIKHQFGANIALLRIYSKQFPAGTIKIGGNRAHGYQGGENLQYQVIVGRSHAM